MKKPLGPNQALEPTMTTAIDLDAYFQRIGYASERGPTLLGSVDKSLS